MQSQPTTKTVHQSIICLKGCSETRKPTYRYGRLAFTVMLVEVCSYYITTLMPFPAMFITAISPFASPVLIVALPFVIVALPTATPLVV